MTTLAELPGDHDQVGDKDAPPDPTLEAVQAMIRAAPQLHRAFHDTDAAFNPIPKVLALLEPTLLFVRLAFFRPRARLGQSTAP